MSRVKANCPSCAAPVKFRIGTSLVAVCEFCHTVVARGDRAIEDLGKVAELADTQSPLQLGLRGKFDGKAFEIVGRCQFLHEGGGVWDEWYCAFNNKRWGWLAEAQGRFYLTFEWEPPDGMALPDHSKLAAGRQVRLKDDLVLTVAEVGTAKAAGAEGELPFLLKPGESHHYADLAGENGTFATFDYGQSPPVAFVGHQATLDDLGLGEAKAVEKEAKEVSSLAVSCPQCGGALELRAPDQAQRVVCPYCRSMLDATQGTLVYLSTIEPLGVREPRIPLGTQGTLQGVEYTVIGFVTRSVTYSGLDYFWDEYLLYQPKIGFRWLVESDHHWSYVEPVSVGEIHVDGRKLTFKGETYRLFQSATARVRYVVGEFYWKVTVGEEVHASDFVRPPQMVSVEDTVTYVAAQNTTSSERNVSLGTYLPHPEVERAFGVRDLPRGEGVAPNQPFPYAWIYRDAAAFVAVLFVVGMLFLGLSQPREVFRTSVTIPPLGRPAAARPVNPSAQPGRLFPQPGVQPAAAPAPPPVASAGLANPSGMSPGTSSLAESAVFFSNQPLELHSRRPIQISVSTSVQNSWVHVAGDLFNEETGLVQSFSVPVEFYSGYDGGEHWSEGSRSGSTVLSALPGGKYTLRLETQSGSTVGEPVSVTVEEGHFRLPLFLLAMVVVGIVPVCLAMRHFFYERARWKDSDYSPFGQTGGSDDDDDE